ncbi:N-terminal C2 in EEIG1 and EHBP1 proteins-domain-containing protein [Stachybotrys elegans]|uniref:N-terminal C2 in EEIG1 and EHBP1 proteins-domain-containing protein n=1 Tax=Stachybotrys elegans TaxID=80388 RepID=A0A8K0WL51_9HYPO|nr:N-terminal C2 in EEIG1 and EHBP1 proteins-domain-containing protein [Stachybotrys elegans]
MDALIGKNRKPKFDLHLQIYDLNNVPLVSGSSFIKWHLAHSIHAEHRGRTSKCPIANHRVEYNFTKVVPSIRISIDKNNCLGECPIEFEVLQEFPVSEKITLGYVRFNLSEYVEESEAFVKDAALSPRRRNSSFGTSGTTLAPPSKSGALPEDEVVEEGIVRRHLMQDSKVNSTLRIGILMIQVDGDRNYVSPPLRTAPVFGGITGLIAPDQAEDDAAGPVPNISKSRDHSELQDLYRRTLAASWQRQLSELPADEVIEDIFAGGDGWGSSRHPAANDADEHLTADDHETHATLRPIDMRRLHQHRRQHSGHSHRRNHSVSSDKSTSTVVEHSNSLSKRGSRRDVRGSRDEDMARSRSGSLVSMASTLRDDSSMRDTGLKRVRELQESDLRDDLIAWRLPGSAAT